jgi:hypothetical protein
MNRIPPKPWHAVLLSAAAIPGVSYAESEVARFSGMKPSVTSWFAILSAAAIPVPWCLAVVLAEVRQCGLGTALVAGEYAAVLMIAAMMIVALIATFVVRAWKGPFPLRNWCIGCGTVAFGIAIYGIFAVVNQGSCDMGLS